MNVEAGYTSLVELEALHKELVFMASLYNDTGDYVKHRTVKLVYMDGLNGRLVWSPKTTTYTRIEPVYLYSIETTDLGRILTLVN